MIQYAPRISLLVAMWLAISAQLAYGRDIEVPLQFDYDFIRQALITQVYSGMDGEALVWEDGSGCGYLRLKEPSVSAADNRIRVVTCVEARLAVLIGDQCRTPIQWQGFVEAFEEPYLSPDRKALEFRVVESNIYNNKWEKGFVTGRLWDLVKKYAHPSFEAVRIDLNLLVNEVRDLLPLIVARGDAARIEAILGSLHLTDVTASDLGVRVTMGFTISDITKEAAPAPEPALTPEELARWQETWQRWDAFLTFVIKQFGYDTPTQELRKALSDVLIEARFDILEVLTPSGQDAPDPTRSLFLKTWERLAPVVRHLAATKQGATALRYMSFVAASDALAALDQVAPEVGLDISADGLRRLARTVAPLSTEDPLLYSTAVDPDLRQMFGLGPPLPPPDLSAEQAHEAWWHKWLTPQYAMAAVDGPAPGAIERWIPPDPDNIDDYLKAIGGVLDQATQKTLGSSDIEEQYRGVYQHLVLATAWQETCWRQFIRKGGKATYIKSAVGSTGLMQINEHVWRGIYDLRGLRWDIHYNARAGTEILMHYLKDYVIAHAQEGSSKISDFLARATYQVYNGGPGNLARFIAQKIPKAVRRIDDLFWAKYQAICNNQKSELVHCLTGR